MNLVKTTSSLLLLASILGMAAPLHANNNAMQLPYMYADTPASIIEQANKIPWHQKIAMQKTMVELYGKEVEKLLPIHKVHPQKLMELLGHVGENTRKVDRIALGFLQAILGVITIGMGYATLKSTVRSDRVAFGSLSCLSMVPFGICLAGFLRNMAPLDNLPKMDIANQGILGLRAIRQTIAKDLADDTKGFFINNLKLLKHATVALSVEKAYSKKQLQIAAIGSAVLLSAAVLFLAVAAIRHNTKAAAATLGAGALGGLAGLLSLSPFATPVINERLKRLQSEYRNSRQQVLADRSH